MQNHFLRRFVNCIGMILLLLLGDCLKEEVMEPVHRIEEETSTACLKQSGMYTPSQERVVQEKTSQEYGIGIGKESGQTGAKVLRRYSLLALFALLLCEFLLMVRFAIICRNRSDGLPLRSMLLVKYILKADGKKAALLLT